MKSRLRDCQERARRGILSMAHGHRSHTRLRSERRDPCSGHRHSNGNFAKVSPGGTFLNNVKALSILSGQVDQEIALIF